MNVFASLSKLIKSIASGQATKEITPEGFCPNCWGRQEYQGKFYEAIENNNIDINNISDKKGWIDAYASEFLSGIQLQPNKDNEMVCSMCKVGYTEQ